MSRLMKVLSQWAAIAVLPWGMISCNQSPPAPSEPPAASVAASPTPDPASTPSPATPSPTPSAKPTAKPSFPALTAWKQAKLTHTLKGHTEDVQALAFSPDGKQLASASTVIRLWDVASGELVRELPGHSVGGLVSGGLVTALAFSPDGRWLVSTVQSAGVVMPDHAAIIWDRNTGQVVHSLLPKGSCRTALFTPHSQLLLTACDRGLQWWNPQTGQQTANFYNRSIETMALSADGTQLATVDANTGNLNSNSQIIRLWTLQGQAAIPAGTLEGHSADVASVQFSPAGDRLISSSFDRTIRIWDWRRKQSVKVLSDIADPVFTLSPDNQLMAGNFRTGLLQNWKAGGDVTSSITVQMQGGAMAIAFSPNGKTLAWAGLPPDNLGPLIRLWQVTP